MDGGALGPGWGPRRTAVSGMAHVYALVSELANAYAGCPSGEQSVAAERVDALRSMSALQSMHFVFRRLNMVSGSIEVPCRLPEVPHRLR